MQFCNNSSFLNFHNNLHVLMLYSIYFTPFDLRILYLDIKHTRLLS